MDAIIFASHSTMFAIACAGR